MRVLDTMNRHALGTCRLVLAATALAMALPATAQDASNSPFLIKIEGGGVHQADADLGDSTGGFAVDRGFVSASLDFGWSLRDSVGISIGGGKSSYEFSDNSGFGGGRPWAKVEDARIALNWRSALGQTGSFFLSPVVHFDGEDGADDTSTYGFFAAAAWRLSESLTIGPGIGAFTRLEDSARFFPILAIDWDITERWNLSTGSGLAASRGPGLTLRRRMGESWSLGLSSRYEDIEFRLDDSGPAPGGVGRDLSVPVVLMATIEPDPRMKFSVFTGVELFGTLKLKSHDGDVLEESDYDPAPLFGASFEIRL